MFQRLLMAFALTIFPLPALPQETDAAKGPEIERIDPSVKSVEGESLPFNSQAPRLVVGIPSEVDPQELRAAGTGNLGLLADTLVKDVNAIRILAIMTQPGETITFNLKSEQSKVRMAVYPDSKATKMKSAITRANMPPNAARSKKLVFTNATKEPYEMLLFVYGLHGYQYQLTWESKLKK